MAELRLESWLFHSDTDSATPLQGLFQRRKEPVTDLAVWMQCYASLTSVLVEKYPQYAKHFLAYMATIVTGYKRFKGLCWAACDAAYRRKAARTKSLLWGNVDQYLYTVWFTNQAQGPSCTNCLSCEHTIDTCPNLPIPPWATASLPTANANQLESIPTASRAHAHQTGPRTMRPLQRSQRASLCLQPLQVLPYLQIMWWSSCVLMPSPLQKTPAKPQQNPNWQPQKFMKPFPNLAITHDKQAS